MNTFTRFSLPLLFLAPLSACEGRVLDVGSAGASSGEVVGPDAGTQTKAPLPEGTIAELEEAINAIAVDATHVYLAGDGNVYSVPKTGGEVIALVADAAASSTPKTAVAVDDAYVYFSNIGWSRVARVPKGGGPLEIVADGLGSPDRMAMDATHVYISVGDNFIPGAPPGPAIVRAPKAGGPIELVAGGQPIVTALTLHGDDVYFAGGYHDPEGSLRRVPKTGGTVDVLVSPVDTRQPPGNYAAAGAVRSVEIVKDKLAFVEPVSQRLAFAPLTGGAVERTQLQVGATVLAAGGFLFVATLDTSTWEGALQRVDEHAGSGATVARWSYSAATGAMASISPARAMATDGDHIFWADFDNHTASTTEPIRATIRSAKAK